MKEVNSSIDKKTQILGLIFEQGILPLYYHADEEKSKKILQALYVAGVRTVEYTNRGEAAVNNFKALRRLCDAELHGMQLGVGTVKTGDEAKAFVDAGAHYLISPGVVKAAAKVAEKAGLLYVPGCMTPTEIIKAESLGATFMKIFPGHVLGPAYITAIRDIFPALTFMVTGGVEPGEENLRGWFGAGVSAVGMGSKLISREAVESGNYERLINVTRDALNITKSIRNAA